MQLIQEQCQTSAGYFSTLVGFDRFHVEFELCVFCEVDLVDFELCRQRDTDKFLFLVKYVEVM